MQGASYIVGKEIRAFSMLHGGEYRALFLLDAEQDDSVCLMEQVSSGVQSSPFGNLP